MKKIISAMLLLLMLAAVAYATTDLRVTAGYTTFAMNDVNNFLNSVGGATTVTNGYEIAADLLCPIPNVPKLSIGPRVEYLGCNNGSASNSATSVSIKQYMIPLMVGGRYIFTNNDRLSLSGNLFVGVGLGYASIDVAGVSSSYTGSSFNMDASAEGSYKLSDSVNIILDLGYRLADVGSMSAGGYGSGGGSPSGGITYAPRKVGTINTTTGSSSISYDFSGMFINIGACFKFK